MFCYHLKWEYIKRKKNKYYIFIKKGKFFQWNLKNNQKSWQKYPLSYFCDILYIWSFLNLFYCGWLSSVFVSVFVRKWGLRFSSCHSLSVAFIVFLFLIDLSHYQSWGPSTLRNVDDQYVRKRQIMEGAFDFFFFKDSRVLKIFTSS